MGMCVVVGRSSAVVVVNVVMVARVLVSSEPGKAVMLVVSAALS